jgi:hypothetical protein
MSPAEVVIALTPWALGYLAVGVLAVVIACRGFRPQRDTLPDLTDTDR